MAQCNVNMEFTTNDTATITSFTTNDTNTITSNTAFVNTINYNPTTGIDYWDQTGVLTVDNYSNIYYSSIQDSLNNIIKQNKEKENEKMTNEFDFGPYNGSDIRLSTYGIALKNKVGKFVSYDRETRRLMDVDVLNVPVETKKIFYKIPKALEDVREGDVIIHNGALVFVEHCMPSTDRFTVIDPVAGTEYVALPLTSPFGYDYIVSIISLADSLPAADSKNPFGSLLPFLLSGKDNNGILLALAMGGDMSEIDPMMLMLMSGNDISPFLIMQMMNNKKKNRREELYQALKKNHSRKDDIDE